MNTAALLLIGSLAVAPPTPATNRTADAPAIARKIDEALAAHWISSDIKPAPLASDADFMRRVSIDLIGRIPTFDEVQAFMRDPAADKRARLVAKLMASPEYPLHFGRVLDGIIQDKLAGDGEFIAFLREAVEQGRGWDRLFGEVVNGPWDTKDMKRSSKFLMNRIKSIDDLTTDTSRVFFGVNVSCAKCHDHPLVPDWTQEHYFGLASFLNRTVEATKNKPQDGIKEAMMGEVKYTTVKGAARTAKPMFLSSKIVEAVALKGQSPISLRRELVRVAIEDKVFFRRAIVNRLWANFFGRGLVDPIDQMHAANEPSVPNLLEWLGDDLAAHEYRLDRVVAGIVLSRAYQLSSTGPESTLAEQEQAFARSTLRPLTPQQYAASVLMATGQVNLDAQKDAKARINEAKQLDGRANGLTRFKMLDAPTDRFQSSAVEALFLSNHPEVQKLVLPGNSPFVATLAKISDSKQLLETAFVTILSRSPDADEAKELAPLLNGPAADRPRRISQLVWALVTSAEFRFNH